MAPIALQKVSEELSTSSKDDKSLVNVATATCAGLTAGYAAIQALPPPAQRVVVPLGIAAAVVAMKMTISPSHHASGKPA